MVLAEDITQRRDTVRTVTTQAHTYTAHHQIHSFIHCGDLYSAFSR